MADMVDRLGVEIHPGDRVRYASILDMVGTCGAVMQSGCIEVQWDDGVTQGSFVGLYHPRFLVSVMHVPAT